MNTNHARHPSLLRLALLGIAFFGVLIAQMPREAAVRADGAVDRLTSQPALKVEAAAPVKVGATLKTAFGQRRRTILDGGIALYINEDSEAIFRAAGLVELVRGEIYVEAPRREGKSFTVKTPNRTFQTEQGTFGVRFDKDAALVRVTSGKVRVDAKLTVVAGWELLATKTEPTPMPRASHVFAWAKDLMIAAEATLVPASNYAGGSLLALDPDGQEAKITLRKFHIDVVIEDGFARTTIDQTYFNHEQAQLEGTFYFPLPADASLSRLAMYVGGNLMEGGMAERDEARNIYETIRYANRDPALLEWLDGTTFKMRVFPMEPRTEKRIVLSYTQRLSPLYGQATYRFPAGHNLKTVQEWTFRASVKDAAESNWSSPSHKLKAHKDAGDLVLEASAANARVDRDVVLHLDSPHPKAGDAARFAQATVDQAKYLVVRFRPELQVENPKPKNEHKTWMFLFEASGDRDPLLGRAQIEIVRHLLAQMDAEDTFMVAAANTRVRYQSAKPQAATAANIKAAVEFLEGAHLIGALDLAAALDDVKAHLPKDACLVHVGSGVAAMGEKREEMLVKKLPEGTAYVGIGVGRRWNRAFMKAAAEATSGHYTQINPDEPIGWRVFDLCATLNIPRLGNVQVIADDGQTEISEVSKTSEIVVKHALPKFLLMQETLAQGEELCAVTRAVGPAPSLPKTIRIRGTVNGKPFEQALKVENAPPRADYLPRTWAKLEVDRLLAKDAFQNKAAIVELSKAMYVMTPFTSLLVLEHEDLYTQYKVDRGRKDHWAMYDCPQKISVVYEPEPGQPDPKTLAGKPTAKQVVRTLRMRENPSLLKVPGQEVPIVTGSTVTATGLVPILRPAASLQGLGGARESGIGRMGGREVDLLGSNFTPFGVPNRNYASKLVAGVDMSMPPMGGMASEAPRQLYEFFGREIREQAPVLMSRGIGRKVLVTDRVEELLHASGDLRQIEGDATSGLQDLRFAVPRSLHLSSTVAAREQHLLRNVPKYNPPGIQFAPVYLSNAEYRDGGLFRKMQGNLGDSPLILDMGTNTEVAVDPSLLHRKLSYSADDSIFFDLLAYAPGMNTSAADIQAVVEAEAYPLASSRPGQVDAKAREFFDRARFAGWHSLTIAGDQNTPGFRVRFDADGRYVYERTRVPGIQERVVCDGKTITHLYPQLFVGARRDVSRFHRAEFSAMAPWLLPPVEDLARGADVKWIDGRVVAIVPHYEAKLRDLVSPKRERGEGQLAPKIEWPRIHLVFSDDGRMAERQVVRMPEGKVIYRQYFEANGDVRVVDAQSGKELFARKGKLEPLEQAPDMKSDTKSLVMVDLPYRSADHVRKMLKIEKKNLQELRLAEAGPLFASYVGAGNANEALTVFKQCLAAREQKQMGYYVLLASCGVNLDSQNGDVLGEHPSEPLAQYLALHTSPVLRKHASQWAVVSGSWNEGFLQHLAQTHALYQKWQNDRITKGDPAKVKQERQRALDYVRKNRDNAFGWALLSLMQDRALRGEGRGARGEENAAKGEAQAWKDFHGELAEAWRLFDAHPVLGSAARYEVARSLYKSGQVEAARKRFTELYQQAFKEEMLPAIDEDFRQALLGSRDEKDGWSSLMRDTASQLVKQKKRPAILALAWQSWQVGDEPLANALLHSALEGIEDGKEKTALTLGSLEFLWQSNQIPQADAVLRELAKEKELAKKPGLWRVGVQFAEQRDMPGRALECLEKTLSTEFTHRPEAIDLRQVREEYGKLLASYEKLAESMVTLNIKPPADFVAKVVGAADHWRALDPDSNEACGKTAWILQRLGEKDLAWDYLTTPVAHKPSEADPWVTMANELSRRGVLDLADRAFKAAVEAEPTNAQILWDRATNLRHSGKTTEAQALFRQIAEGDWQPRFQGLRNQARSQSGN